MVGTTAMTSTFSETFHRTAMPHRVTLVALAIGFAVCSCGGSSSETPPPLEPDQTQIPTASPEPARSATPAPPTDEDEFGKPPQPPAPSTWGSGPSDHKRPPLDGD
jgi:hypothetical protein